MARSALVTRADSVGGLAPHRSDAGILERAAFTGFVLSLAAFSFTLVVGLGGVVAVISGRSTSDAVLELVLRLSEIVTAATFLTGLGLHLGAVFARHRAHRSRHEGRDAPVSRGRPTGARGVPLSERLVGGRSGLPSSPVITSQGGDHEVAV